jgi:RTX calcium-binding nonapeptide repeat (4 copies)
MADPTKQLELTVEDRDGLISQLIAAGLWDAAGQKVVDVVGLQLTTLGAFAPLYSYVGAIIARYPNIDYKIKYWFSEAPKINGDDRESPADNYIRGVTQYGLEFNNKLTGLSQSQIDTALQLTSNLIGQNVMQGILDLNGIVDFGTMLTGDISAAIGKDDLAIFGHNIKQTIGGWGGSFYFWNEALHYNTPTQITVGDAIRNGVTPESPQKSLDEFFWDNSNAQADFGIYLLRSIPKIALPNLPGKVFLVLKELPASGLPKVIADVQAALDSLFQAQAPRDIKGVLARHTLGVLLGRLFDGKFVPGPHTPNSSSVPPYVLSRSSSGDGVTVTYSDGSEYSQNLAGTTLNWSDAAGNSGTVAINESGAIVAARDASGATEAAIITSDNRIAYVSGDGARVVSTGAGQETLYGGDGDNTFVLQTVIDGIANTIVDRDGKGRIWVGTAQITDDTQQIAYNEGAAKGTWGTNGGKQYKYDEDARTLTITGGDLGSGEIIIANLNLKDFRMAAGTSGFLGIHLAARDKLALRNIAAMPSNPFDDPSFDPDSAPSPSNEIDEGGTASYALYLPYSAGEGGQKVRIQLAGDSANSLRVQVGNQIIAPIGEAFEVTVQEGSDQVTFTLLAIGDVTGAEEVTISAKLIDADGNFTYNTHTIATLTVTASSEEPTGLREILGGGEPINFGTEEDPEYHYDELGNEVTSGLGNREDTLNGGDQNVHIVGGIGRDSILAGSGNSVIEGNEGRDVIYYSGPGEVRIFAHLHHGEQQERGHAAGERGGDGRLRPRLGRPAAQPQDPELRLPGPGGGIRRCAGGDADADDVDVE